MARVPSLTAEDIPAEYQDEFERFTEAFARNPNLVPVYFHCPEMARFIFGMGAEFRAKEVLPPRLVEIIVVTVSKVNDCPYCTAHH
ncbi:MAG: carboxymuconolactone decarboxylase family protein, partial [Rickettsiales bacterium]